MIGVDLRRLNGKLRLDLRRLGWAWGEGEVAEVLVPAQHVRKKKTSSAARPFNMCTHTWKLHPCSCTHTHMQWQQVLLYLLMVWDRRSCSAARSVNKL